MGNKNKEQSALIIGFALILLVLLLTLFRSDVFSGNKSGDSKSNSAAGKQSTIAPNYQTISATDLQKQILINDKNQKRTLLDIRSFRDYSQEHILDSVGLPIDEFPVGQKIDVRSQIIVIGKNASDGDLAIAVDNLEKENFKNILVLAGGMESWKTLLGTTVTYGNPESFVDQSKVSYLDPQELQDAIIAKVPLFIVDVRSKEQFSEGHIEGALNIPLEEIEKRRQEITKRKAIVVGINELQEFQAAVQMYDMLLISPYVMRTAMPGWQDKGFELVK